MDCLAPGSLRTERQSLLLFENERDKDLGASTVMDRKLLLGNSLRIFWDFTGSYLGGKTYVMEYYSAIKRNEIELFVVRWMDLETIVQSEVSQKEKNKYHMLTHKYGI